MENNSSKHENSNSDVLPEKSSRTFDKDLDALLNGNLLIFEPDPDEDESNVEDSNVEEDVLHEQTAIEDEPSAGTSRRQTMPKAIYNLMGQANICCANRDFEGAIKICKDVISDSPRAPEPYVTIALIYEEQGDLVNSFKWGVFAMRFTRQDTSMWLHYAKMAEQLGRYNDAIACYSSITRCDKKQIQPYLKRIELYQKLNLPYKVAYTYSRLVAVSTSAKFAFDCAKKGSTIYHELNNIPKAIEILEMAFKQFGTDAEMEEVNLLAELYNATKAYFKTLELISLICDVQIEAEEDMVRDDATEEVAPTSFRVISCHLSRDVPLQILIKLLVALVNLQAFHIVDSLTENLIQPEILEDNGDLVFEVAECLMTQKRHQEALRLLKPLVKTVNYDVAAIWLAYAECLKFLNRAEEAVSAYLVVMDKAPHLSEPRLVVSQLLNDMGRSDEALCALTQHLTNNVFDLDLLYERFHLLKDKPERKDELLAVGRIILSRHCIRIRNTSEVKAIVSMKGLRSRRAALDKLKQEESENEGQMEVDRVVYRGQTGPSADEEWELFLNVIQMTFDNKQFSLLQRLIFSALGSSVLCKTPTKQRKLNFLAALACIYNEDTQNGFAFARELAIKEISNVRIWHLFNLISLQHGDLRHQKFIMRLLNKNPTSQILSLLHAHSCYISGTYKHALSEYLSVFKHEPTPLVALMITSCFLQLLAQKSTTNQNSMGIQALGFLSEYKKLRGDLYAQETHYNMGRLMHQLNLLPSAVYHYKKVFETAPVMEKYDLTRDAAFNLCAIYKASQAYDLAQYYMEKYIII